MAKKSGTPYRDAARKLGFHNGARAKRGAKKLVRVTRRGIRRMKKIKV